MKFIDTRDVVRELVPKYAKGKTLDVGGGNSKYRKLIIPYVNEYLVSDLYPSPGVDFIEDARRLKQTDKTYDTVLSFQVLEHIDNTSAVVSEMYRILKDGGVAIVTAPFIAAEHGHPSDYHRFTVEGMRWYFEQVGFNIIEAGKQGSTFTMISELFRFGLLNPYKKHGRIKSAIINRILNIFKKLDKRGFMANSDFYTNVYIVAKK